MTGSLTERTIDDFGDQWTRYTDNDGYYASPELLTDIFGPLMAPEALRGKRVAEIGSGTGRIVGMLLAAGVAHVTAVEPSRAMSVLKRNTERDAARITYLECRGDQLPPEPQQDAIVSIGVLHHIPDPKPVVAAAYNALKPGGWMLAWLYGWEGNAAYLGLVLPIRKLTTKLPHSILAPLCHFLNAMLAVYIWLARHFPLPLRGYMTEVIGRFSAEKRYLVIYDQLKPSYAKYYRRDEALRLLEEAGFTDVRLHHRHGYSWTVLGRRPLENRGATQ
ncbi:methyltransferase domain-containing protein [Mesorhizobium sp. BAC0120]|uniref:class I SAM-dependent methyltransferase n=1 Tax=Mesorhizobium sp. BAC0120 TaxID=3090670 RepID=UPI00298C0CFA|nr:methyltransferase [Mesorhizobium sp. BAC0120]MDW6020956.1 methyltransferase domain-containing protein [Mesorhizobium sp. BAC0120]